MNECEFHETEDLYGDGNVANKIKKINVYKKGTMSCKYGRGRKRITYFICTLEVLFLFVIHL